MIACSPFASAYFRMARSMRVCVKQRHRTPPTAIRMSSSEAPGFTSRTAFAVRITPLRQNPHCAAPSSMKACWRGCGFTLDLVAVWHNADLARSLCGARWCGHSPSLFPVRRGKNAPQGKRPAKTQEATAPCEGSKTAQVVVMRQRKNGPTAITTNRNRSMICRTSSGNLSAGGNGRPKLR